MEGLSTSTNLSPSEFVKSFKEEQSIYETPYNEQIDHESVYNEPPDEVKKIYESIDGQYIHKLNRDNIR